MADTYLGNTLINSDSTQTIAYGEQLKDRTITWGDYHYLDADNVQQPTFPNYTDNDKFQDKINRIVLNHYTEFKAFLNSKGLPGVIDTWEDVAEFLSNIDDSEAYTLMTVISQAMAACGDLEINMSNDYPGLMTATQATGTSPISLDDSNIGDDGVIRLYYSIPAPTE